MDAIEYSSDLENVDWKAMKRVLQEDDFDNGRSPEQLKASFENSFAACIAYWGGANIIGTARVLSDGVCNAYVVDVWTLSTYRRQGIAREMMQRLTEKLEGQHVYLFTDDAEDFYRNIGFRPRGVGMEKVIGSWLVNNVNQG